MLLYPASTDPHAKHVYVIVFNTRRPHRPPCPLQRHRDLRDHRPAEGAHLEDHDPDSSGVDGGRSDDAPCTSFEPHGCGQ